MCLREKKSAQIREILISESAWEEMTCLFAPSLEQVLDIPCIHRYVGLCLWIVYPLAVTSKPSSQGEGFG